ncbi:dephospho-CoA kinase [Brevibacillus sp. SYSU BS000544]|uniref:dephospho-CoA kinase n=1 Tax=Brevibacillus sp. SYSU BS000544 TaxID=3416443 RepID=UPI003CE50B83
MIIGLTGGIASGKSTVSALLKERRIPVVDADVIAREVVEPGKSAYQQIVDAFGSSILLPTGEIDRKALGEIVFSDERQRQVLNGIVHPQVRKEMTRQAKEASQSGHELVVMDIPLLFESKLQYMVDKIVLVYVPSDLQLIRLMERDKIDEEQAQKRIKSQFPIETKKNEADFIIDNSGTREETKVQVDQLLVTLRAELKQ